MSPAAACCEAEASSTSSGALQHLACLQDRWPGREGQVTTILKYLGGSHDRGPTLFIHGGTGTGKTSVVRDIFRELQRPFAYVHCAEATKPRKVLQMIVSQLKSKKRKADNGYAGPSSCEHLLDFLQHLSGVAPAGGPTRYIILDHVNRLAEQDLLAALMRLPESSGCAVSLILISQVVWGRNLFERDMLHMPRPLPVAFPRYEQDELVKILARHTPEGADPAAYKKFLQITVPSHARVSCSFTDLQHFAAGAAGLASGHNSAGAANKRLPVGVATNLPYLSKFLLLAAYIASRNRKALDSRVFDTGARSGRRRGAQASDKQVEEAREAMLGGPHVFELERLLYVFWSLVQAEDEAGDEKLGLTPKALQSAEVDLLICDLCSLGLLSQASGDVLEGVAKYRCNIEEEYAQAIANGVSVQLNGYLLYV